AFYPAKIPFPLLHIDTGYKFREMIEFRDYFVDKIGAKLIVHKNEEEKALKFKPEDANSESYIYYKKTKPLLEILSKHKFDAAFVGARRDEEKSRAKERIFSLRDANNRWDPKSQRPEMWSLYNTRISEQQSMRVFPLSNWTELDIWNYIKREQIEIVPLYFAEERKVIKRDEIYLRIDEFVQEKDGEVVEEIYCRFRTLGCSPSTGAVPSKASSIDEIIEELLMCNRSERESRLIDKTSDSSLESKKREGYF
ncbi:sulfate adenylyltransferase subunit CysD, partial [Candidatus Peregrinibacteria bacterium]|nr:sulfate adenylyltransferase subunit CysD [Candidatus Peregrinibacteria bacterium]